MLFADRARQIRPSFDLAAHSDEVAEIVSRLDGLPLAIEFAAGRLDVLSRWKQR